MSGQNFGELLPKHCKNISEAQEFNKYLSENAPTGFLWKIVDNKGQKTYFNF